MEIMKCFADSHYIYICSSLERKCLHVKNYNYDFEFR